MEVLVIRLRSCGRFRNHCERPSEGECDALVYAGRVEYCWRMRARTLLAKFATPAVLFGCGAPAGHANAPVTSPEPAAISNAPATTQPLSVAHASEPAPLQSSPRCSPADWSPRSLAPLLKPGKTAQSTRADRSSANQPAFVSECSDAPPGAQPEPRPGSSVVLDGVEIRLAEAVPAGASRRGWPGNQCSFELRLADGSGPWVRLSSQEVPPFNSVSALVRAGSAAWVSLSFNGYTREFPQGGNRIIALDLCNGRVVWKSNDSVSNGGLLLLDDYLVSPFGFTSEPRFLFVLDAHNGNVVQKLPIVENVCPSKRWAPNWRRGERCDAPGQKVGAANDPRVESGVLFVDTNTGSSTFQFL
ncbi:MAG: hypothetical protein ACOY0T_33695 [Myxococcota bacterium]